MAVDDVAIGAANAERQRADQQAATRLRRRDLFKLDGIGSAGFNGNRAQNQYPNQQRPTETNLFTSAPVPQVTIL
jgi:hypothetical protein